MKKSIFYTLISCLTFTSPFALAEGQKAHIHGVATVTLAVEGDKLEMLIESPAEALVGFEHKARSNKEKKAVKQAEKLLKSPELLFSFNGTSCKSDEVSVDLSKLLSDEHDHHKESHGHKDHHEHEKNHKHEDKHEHEHDHESHSEDHKEHGHDKHNHSEDGHSEISATYLVSCDKAANLKSVSVKLFKLFPRIEKIKAMWITEKRQGADLLDRAKSEISLR